MFRNSPPSAPIHPWHFPEHPWTQIHIDFAGPFLGKMFLVIIDAHSKWMEIHTMKSSTNASATIEKLRQTFAIFGLPQELVSDNAPVFASQSFQIFMSENGIKHIRATPYHPASNGLAVRAVQTFKIGMKKLSGPLETKLSRFLFVYHTTPQTSTGLAPAQLMFGRRLRTRLDLLFPHSSVVDSVRKSQERMIVSRQGRKLHVFEPQDLVYCRDFKSAKPSWCPAKVVSKTGPLSYQVQMRDGRITKRHVDHLMQCSAISEVDETNDDETDDEILVSPSSLWEAAQRFSQNVSPQETGSPRILQRRSARSRQPPDRYVPTWWRRRCYIEHTTKTSIVMIVVHNLLLMYNPCYIVQSLSYISSMHSIVALVHYFSSYNDAKA